MKPEARRGFAPIFIVLIIAVALALSGGALYYARKSFAPKPVVCTQEAKQCLDRSYVGRTGPNCEFTECPEATSTAQSTSTQDITAGWKTYRNEKYGFEFKYPQQSGITESGQNYNLGVLDERDPGLKTLRAGSKWCSFLDLISNKPSIIMKEGGIQGISICIITGTNTIIDVSAAVRPILGVIHEQVNIAGSEALRGSYGGMSWGEYVAILHNGLTIELDDNGLIISKELFDQILSTLKFIPSMGSEQATAGTLTGKVSIGPICPVERIDVPCPVPPEAYASREFLVLSSDQSKTITSLHANASGTYSVSLPSGNYVVVSAKTGIGFLSKDLPATIMIKSGQTTTLNISVDTGIR